MSIRYILFDLDGTLLPMDQDLFVKAYFKGLAIALSPHGYDPRKLTDAIWAGTGSMIRNDGSRTNEEVFWDKFCAIFGEAARADEPRFEQFYRTGFQQVQQVCGFDPRAAQVIRTVKERGFTPVLATNPIFPAIATESRIRWAGLDKDDFALYTTYENSNWCKPSPDYYLQILRKLAARPEECVMIGNDVTEDMVARELGMQVFLLTDCVINKDHDDIDRYPHGSFDQLLAFLRTL